MIQGSYDTSSYFMGSEVVQSTVSEQNSMLAANGAQNSLFNVNNMFEGMSLSTATSDESCTLFLGDLSVYCTEKDIRKLFRPFGLIEAIRVKRGSSNKTNLSYGFIKFSTKESAEQALNQLNGVMFLGRALRIGWAEGKSPAKVPKSKEEKKVETAQVHVSFISKQIDVLISEATIRGLFGLYGEVVDVALKKSQFDKNLKIQNGYGFVHFPLTEQGIKSAITAVNSLHQVTIDRVTYDCSVSHALEPFLKQANEFGMDSFAANFSSLLQSSINTQSPQIRPMQSHRDERIVDPLNLYRPSKEPGNRTTNHYHPRSTGEPSSAMNFQPQPLSYVGQPTNNDYMLNGMNISGPATAPIAYRPLYSSLPVQHEQIGFPAGYMPQLPLPRPVAHANYTYNNFYAQNIPGIYPPKIQYN